MKLARFLILASLVSGCAASEGIPLAILDGVLKVCSVAAISAPIVRPLVTPRDAGTD